VLLATHHLGHAKIHQDRLALIGDHDVRRFHVPMDHAAIVCVLQGITHAGCDVARL
jgi:hypothetical protein